MNWKFLRNDFESLHSKDSYSVEYKENALFGHFQFGAPTKRYEMKFQHTVNRLGEHGSPWYFVEVN